MTKHILVFYRLPANIFLFKIITCICILVFVNLYLCLRNKWVNEIEPTKALFTLICNRLKQSVTTKLIEIFWFNSETNSSKWLSGHCVTNCYCYLGAILNVTLTQLSQLTQLTFSAYIVSNIMQINVYVILPLLSLCS